MPRDYLNDYRRSDPTNYKSSVKVHCLNEGIHKYALPLPSLTRLVDETPVGEKRVRTIKVADVAGMGYQSKILSPAMEQARRRFHDE